MVESDTNSNSGPSRNWFPSQSAPTKPTPEINSNAIVIEVQSIVKRDTNSDSRPSRKVVPPQNIPTKPTPEIHSNAVLIKVQSIPTIEGDVEDTDSSSNKEEFGNEQTSMASEYVSYFNGFYPVLTILASLLASSIITLIPYHDVLRYPQFWYEFMIQMSFGILVFDAIFRIVEASWILNYKQIVSPKRIAIIALERIVFMVVSNCIVYVIWCVYLGFNPPMPKTGLAVSFPSLIHILVRIWFEFPTELRQDDAFRKRLKWYLAYVAAKFMIKFGFFPLLNVSFQIIPSNLNWMMAFVLPATREISDIILGKLITRASNNDKHTALCLMKIDNAIFFEFYIAIQLVKTVDELTIWLIFGVDFILNIFFYISLKRKHQTLTKIGLESAQNIKINEDENNMLTEFVLTKSTEVVVPITFVLAYLMAYHGPNYGILGDIGCNYWQYQKMEDISNFIRIEFTMFVAILMNLSLSCIIAWAICGKDILRVYCTVMKKFWYIILLQTVCKINLVKIDIIMYKLYVCINFAI